MKKKNIAKTNRKNKFSYKLECYSDESMVECMSSNRKKTHKVHFNGK